MGRSLLCDLGLLLEASAGAWAAGGESLGRSTAQLGIASRTAVAARLLPLCWALGWACTAQLVQACVPHHLRHRQETPSPPALLQRAREHSCPTTVGGASDAPCDARAGPCLPVALDGALARRAEVCAAAVAARSDCSSDSFKTATLWEDAGDSGDEAVCASEAQSFNSDALTCLGGPGV